MFLLIWTSLFLCIHATQPSPGVCMLKFKQCQTGSYCITLIEQEITAVAGLCVVIPCYFTTNNEFNVTSFNWYQCDEHTTEKCNEPNTVKPVFAFNTSVNLKSGFKGRVTMMEPDLSLKKCSITISDLKTSDSGSYQVRLLGHINGKDNAFTFLQKTTLTVKGLSQKPKVMVPPLTAGQQNTLTCTAPGLCSGSVPQITWTWRKPGENNSYITGNITDTKTENVSDVTQRHSSTLTFDLSAGHNNTEVTCKVNFGGNIVTEETVTLNVHYVSFIRCKEEEKKNTTDQRNCTQSVSVHHNEPRSLVLLSVAAASLVVNVLLMISFIYLWFSKIKSKPKEDKKSDELTQEEQNSDVYENVPKHLK